MARAQNLAPVGKRFGKLVVTGETFKDGDVKRCPARCDCGKTCTPRLYSLTCRKTRSCGCGKSRRGNANSSWKGVGGISGALWCHIRRAAQVRGIDFLITQEYAWELFLRQEGCCALTGETIHIGHQSGGMTTASLDRKDSSKGYVEGNVQWVHKDINVAKGVLTNEELVFWCQLVVDHDNRRRSEP